MPRDRRFPIAGLLVALLLAARSTPAAEPVNLITNGGFEEGLTGWTPDAKHRRAEGAKDAHSGTACLSGEVTGPNQALKLLRSVPVKQGNRYQFEIWARATNQTKLVLWVQQPGTKDRMMVASWPKLPRRWTRCSVPLPAQGDGLLELQIIAPSSHGEPAGQIWVDDVAVYETKMPPLESISAGEGFNDDPAMCRTNDGSVYVAWNSFRDKADSLQIARMLPGENGFKRAGSWQVLGGEGTYVLGLRAIAVGDRAAIVYAAEKDRNWDIYVVYCGPEGPGEPVRVSTGEAVDVKPAVAVDGQTLWLAWECNDDSTRHIVAASVRDGKATPPERVSQGKSSSYDPSIAITAGGEVSVAWHSFRENNYDVYLRSKAAERDWGSTRRLTKAPTIDRHAVLFSRGDELWVVYENAQVATYHVGSTNQRKLVVAKVTQQGLMAPVTPAGKSPLERRCEGPSAVFDASGRLWIAYLQPRLPRSGWDVFLTRLIGDRWEQPTPVSFQKGMDRRPALALAEGRAIVAFQSDNIPNSWSDVDKTGEATSNIFLAAVDPGQALPAEAPAFEPLVENDEPFEPAEIRVARGEDTPTPSITYQGKTLKLYYGDLHEHTDVSVCNRLGDQSVDESYQHMRDLARHDFACATDHGYNFNPYLWSYMAKQARVNDDPDRFLTFLAEEWTSSFEKYDQEHPYGYYGHRNLILADTYFPRWWNSRNGQTPAQMWEEVAQAERQLREHPAPVGRHGQRADRLELHRRDGPAGGRDLSDSRLL